MNSYKATVTWNKIYGNIANNKEECEFLIDALWEMTDIFLPTDYFLSPIECFVLGGAFILHDLGMVFAAYPEGKGGIQKQNIWRDTVANLCKQRGLDNVKILSD